ncbi:MAG: class I SAM-dependent DNA methyltransferase [Oscillospiraceae bacterium]|nr:class I SAM-dependent DNA methyltransferase [Oscillospiraceae bacterium]
MTEKEQKKAAKEFAERWKGKGYEKGQSQLFWIDLLEHVYGVENAMGIITFEDQVHLDHTSFIDGYIDSTKVMIEQKSIGKDLRKGIKQSDGSVLTPFQQAKRYITELPVSKHPRWIITCNFEEFLVYDMEKPNGEPEQIFLKDLGKDYYRLQFLVETGSEMLKKEMEISLKAGELVGKLYDAILKQYKDPESPETLKSLNMLCVRLVFCLYAEHAGIFGSHNMFGRYLKHFPVDEVHKNLRELFKVLNMTQEQRDDYDEYMDPKLAAFPYVNGGLFADDNYKIPRFNEEIVKLLVEDASEGFDWSEISPTIFGAVFESTLNPETRRSGGMHYTSIENIHKVIDPLFLDGLKTEFEQICDSCKDKTDKKRKEKLEEFRDKLASLNFLDPACGSGNFLTETYISLRRLENQVLKTMYGGQMFIGGDDYFNPVKVGISQFYGIELNDFAVTVAKTALWIAESQMLRETEEIINCNLDFLPLKSYANITEGNSLRTDWASVVPKDKLSYIMGNPPFVGYAYQSEQQKEELLKATDNVGKNLDYVSGWYFIAAKFMNETSIRTAFVSTNSICQGEQVAVIWKTLFDKYNIHIDFAHKTFRWDSEASLKAHVHCVIVGFSVAENKDPKKLFSSDRYQIVNNINAYLVEAPTIFIEKRTKPICKVTEIIRGSSPNDDGNLLMSHEEYLEYIKNEPQGSVFIRPFMMGKDFIQRKARYCFWLVDANPSVLKKCPLLLKRIDAVKEFRSKSKRTKTLELANTPTLFEDMRISDERYIAIPKVSSEARRYIPIDYLDSKVIPGDKLFFMKNATLYDFGIITSNVHNAWMRTVCGRLKSDYSYSNTIVYNNFPWCIPTDEQKATIEKTAQMILDARAKYPDCSLADLYDETTMPPELRKAHQLNDKAVMQAYGFWGRLNTESECVAELMKMYQKLTVNS